MKALFLEAAGDTPQLAVRDAPDPVAGPDDAIIHVAACGMCHHDVAVMSGLLRRGARHGAILGHEIAGRVIEVGEAVSSVKVGDRVVSALTTFCGTCARCLDGNEYRCFHAQGVGHAIDGGFAQYVRLPANSVVTIPDSMELEAASILACPIGVALRAIRDVAKLRPGETALVTGAGGGLGVHAIQIASTLGARVLAVTTSPEKVGLLEQLGVAEVILADALDFSEIALALTEDAGADVVVDTVGSATFRSSLRSMAQFGRMVLLGEVTGERASVSLTEILFRDAAILGASGASSRHIRDAAQMVELGQVKPVISEIFALADALQAYTRIREKKTFGRVALKPPS